MKKSLLLAVLLLSSAVKAETWVCSTPSSVGGTYITTFVRDGDKFIATLTVPPTAELGAKTLSPKSYDISLETETMLTLSLPRIIEDGGISVRLINKITNEFVTDAVLLGSDTVRSEGSCVKLEG